METERRDSARQRRATKIPSGEQQRGKPRGQRQMQERNLIDAILLVWQGKTAVKGKMAYCALFAVTEPEQVGLV
jgi:hypothetical protein